MYIYLTHYINNFTPLYGGETAIAISDSNQISHGKSSNTKFLKFPNHTGTHVDFPRHFADTGKSINDYPPSFWKFTNIYIFTYPANCNEILSDQQIDPRQIPINTDFLIINTRFGKERNTDKYWNNNPGLSPELATALKKKCPGMKAIGIDAISVSGYQNRKLGRIAHKEFLINNDILLIEDMKLDNIEDKTITSVIALPLLIDNTDGAPITIIAEYE